MKDEAPQTAAQILEAWMREEIARVPASLRLTGADETIKAWKASPQYQLVEDPSFQKSMDGDESFAAIVLVGLRSAFWNVVFQRVSGTYRAPTAEEAEASTRETAEALRVHAESLG